MNSKQQHMTAGTAVRPIAALLALSVLLCAAGGASGAVVKLTVLPDTVDGATATITGIIPELTDSAWSSLFGPTILNGILDEPANGAYTKWRVLEITGGVKWKVDANIYAIDYYDVGNNHLGFTYTLTVDAQHMIVPHTGDIAPNTLKLLVQHGNLSGLTVTEPLTSAWLAAATVNLDNEKLHPILPGHNDTAHLEVTDKSGALPGYISATKEIHAVVTLAHSEPIPEPASLALLAIGGIALIRRRK